MRYQKVILENIEAKNADDVMLRDGSVSLIRIWEFCTGRQRRVCSYLGCSNNASCATFLKVKGKRSHYFLGAICSECNRQPNNHYYEMKKNTAYIKVPIIALITRNSSDSDSSEKIILNYSEAKMFRIVRAIDQIVVG